ncbi:MAG: hypothetical protein HJJLKODD_01829 [Phycisphaerae bacterium]|nr:hypothetical protein [Phycisphaerae bacterium]
MLKQIYAIIALLAVINLLGLAGLFGLAWSSGRLNKEKVEQMAALLRKAPENEEKPTDAATTEENSDEQSSSASQIDAQLTQEEIGRLKADRALVEIRQQENLLNRRMLELQQDKESFALTKKSWEEQQHKKEEQALSSSFQLVIQNVSSAAPKDALDMLMTMSEADGLKVFSQLDERVRKKILATCRTEVQKTWRERINEQMLKQAAEPQTVQR